MVTRIKAGGNPHLEIMIPLVGAVEELKRMREMMAIELEEAEKASGLTLDVPVGTMIELPRAALIAGNLAEVADFFSFGTNDLTQMTYGLSRDDAQTRFLDMYVEEGILPNNPFQTIDAEGVGRLVRVATREGKEANPELTVGVCGEHGGDPASIRFCREVGPRLCLVQPATGQGRPTRRGPGRARGRRARRLAIAAVPVDLGRAALRSLRR